MYIDVKLVIVCVDWSTGDKYVVSRYKNVFHCPTKQLDIINCDNNLVELAKDLYTETVQLDRNWCNIRVNKAIVKNKEGILNVIYECSVPFNTKLNDSHWISIGEVRQDDLVYDTVLEACGSIMT